MIDKSRNMLQNDISLMSVCVFSCHVIIVVNVYGGTLES